MPCATNLSAPVVQRDLKFWKDYEATFEDNNWSVLFLCGYITLFVILWQKRDNATYRLTRDKLIRLKILAAAFYIGWYISVPFFFAFPSLRILFYFTHMISVHGAITVLRMSNQPDDYQIIINDNECLGYLRSCVVAAIFIFVQVFHTVNSPRSRYYECSSSWLVTWEDLCFKLLLFSHSLAYFIVKNVWMVCRVEAFSIYQNEEKIGNLVNRNGEWVEELNDI